MSLFSPIQQELKGFTRSQKLFIFFAMLAGFSIACEYAVTRPASNAIFLTQFSSAAFPWVWLATVPLNLLIIVLYNKFLPKLGPKRMLLTVALIAVTINLSAGFILPHFPKLVFFHYAWKDIYILLMFKQLWSMIHSTIQSKQAKYLYGLIFGVGTLGSICGSFIPGFFAKMLGSETLFFFTAPIYLVLMVSFSKASYLSTIKQHTFKEEFSPKESFSLIRKNRFLLSVLFLVILMQASVGLMEYQFNAHLELNIFDQDLRTEYCGKVNGIMNLLSGVFQFVGGFLMVHTLGVRGSHLLVPLLLLGSSLLAWAMPAFAVVSASYIFLKSVDFSLFGVIRELLYLPLQMEEKYKAKAIIDVFAYRTSKALVSLAVLLLQGVLGALLLPLLSYASIALFVLWIGVVVFLLRKTYPSTATL